MVFPLVPVTPSTVSFFAGWPYQLHASRLSAERASRTRTQGTLLSPSHTTPAAPAAMAWVT